MSELNKDTLHEYIEYLEKEREYAEARSDINMLAPLIMRDSVTNEPFEQATIHRQMQAHIDKSNFSLIWVPRNHGKTEQVSILRPIYYLGRNHNERIKIICGADNLAIKRLKRVKDLIRRDDTLHKIFPDLEPDYSGFWTKTAITVKREISITDPSVEASGILSTSTGSRATVIILDDSVTWRNSIQQPKLRQAVKDKFYDVLMNALEPGGIVIYICTPWHKDDLSHELRANAEFKLLELSIDADFNSLWPEKRSKKWLIQKKSLIGSRAFDRGFRNKALSDDELVFTPEMLKKLPDYTRSPTSSVFKKEVENYVGIDFAGGATSSGWTVFFGISVDESRKRWVRRIDRGHYSGGQMAELMGTYNEIFNEPTFVVENNGVQSVIIDLLKLAGKTEMKIISYRTGSKKMDLLEGVPSLGLEFEQDMWRICMYPGKHDTLCKCGFCVYMRELGDFPLATTSDIVMAGFFAREGYKIAHSDSQGGFEEWDLSKRVVVSGIRRALEGEKVQEDEKPVGVTFK